MATWTASPSADTYNNAAVVTTGFGTSTVIIVAGGSAAESQDFNGMLRFDITTMPTTGLITATLHIHVTTIAGSNLDQRTLTIYGMTEGAGAEFLEGNGAGNPANWNSPGVGAWDVLGGASDGVLGHLTFDAEIVEGPGPSPVGGLDLNVLDLVQAAVDESYVSMGFLFDLSDMPSGTSSFQFSSKESATEVQRPVLTVTTDESGAGGDGTDRPECFQRIDMARRLRKRKLVWVRFNRL